jgi:nitroreductase
VRYTDMEAGHAAQNLCLQAAALDLKTVVVGAFSDDDVRRIALLPPGEEPLYLVPVGR